MRRVSILLALLGLAAAAALVLRYDAGDILRAVLSVGWRGAAILLLCQGLLFLITGLAWAIVQPGIPGPILLWGRMVRDAATACLPFSPLGGYLLGIRAVTLHGPNWPRAAAGTVVDVGNEIAAQALFALFGLVTLLALRPGSNLALPIAAPGVAVTGAALLAIAASVVAGRRRIGTAIHGLTARILGPARITANLDPLRLETARLYAARPRLALGIAIHLTGWFATGTATWISLRLLGHAPGLLGILALEALLDAAVAAAFVVPGAAGVQEAGYVGLGALFGVPPDIALGVSLLRRAREITWGLPILAIWQWQEFRRL